MQQLVRLTPDAELTGGHYKMTEIYQSASDNSTCVKIGGSTPSNVPECFTGCAMSSTQPNRFAACQSERDLPGPTRAPPRTPLARLPRNDLENGVVR
jgi:hypothetical protein